MRGLQIVGEIDAKEATEQKVLSLGMMGA
jgi:hypothetical protein